jgi:L-aspartate oxidase
MALEEPDTFRAIPLENPRVPKSAETLDLADIRNSLKSLMWVRAGVWRDATGLAEAADSILAWRHYVLTRQLTTPDGWELQNMLEVAELMIHSAAKRTESRGVHLRNDFPAADDKHWRCHVLVRRGVKGAETSVTGPLEGPLVSPA